MNKLNAFMREFVAIVKGDDTEALAAKVWRQGEAALKVAIAGAEGDLISKEEDVESAKEKLRLARANNGKEITDRNRYVLGLVEAQNNLTEAEDRLEAHRKTIVFLKGQYEELKAE